MRLFPQRVSGLILANTRPEPDSEEIKENRKEMARRVADEGVEVLIELQLKRLLAPDTLESNERVVEKVRAMILESNPNGVVAALGAMRERPDSTPMLGKIEVPTLVIGGEEDGISSPEVMRAMAEKIPDSRHVTLPDAGHLSNLEAAEGFNAALKEFLESSDTRRSWSPAPRAGSEARRPATSSKPATRSAPSCATPVRAKVCVRWGRSR
jgi:3-oxoadipate enol-lactonase